MTMLGLALYWVKNVLFVRTYIYREKTINKDSKQVEIRDFIFNFLKYSILISIKLSKFLLILILLSPTRIKSWILQYLQESM